MIPSNQSYLTDATGKKIGVFLSMKEYKKIVAQLEDLNDIKLFKEGKKDKSPSIPIDEAFRIVESLRKK